MVLRRSAKNKGSQFEYSVFDSLLPIYPDLKLTKELGFVLQYDLVSEKNRLAIECKFHKTMSWNEMKKIHNKLIEVASDYSEHVLIFKTNRQPVLAFDGMIVMEFENIFAVPFIQRGTKVKQNEEK